MLSSQRETLVSSSQEVTRKEFKTETAREEKEFHNLLIRIKPLRKNNNKTITVPLSSGKGRRNQKFRRRDPFNISVRRKALSMHECAFVCVQPTLFGSLKPLLLITGLFLSASQPAFSGWNILTNSLKPGLGGKLGGISARGRNQQICWMLIAGTNMNSALAP